MFQFDDVISQYPGDTEAQNSQFYLILAKHRAGDKDGAIAGFQEYVKQNPESDYVSQALYLTAMSYMYNKRDYPKAITYFERTMDWLTTHNEYGDDPKLASKMEDTIVAPGMLYHCCEHIAYAHLFQVEAGIYGYDSVLNWGKRLQTIFPSDRGMHQYGKLIPLLVLESQKQWPELIIAADSLMAQYAQDTKRWLTVPGAVLRLKGEALQQLGRDTEATAVYEKVVTEYQGSWSDPIALCQMGRCYERLQDTYSAISVYNEYIEKYSEVAEIMHEGYLNKASLLFNSSQFEKAAGILDEFLQKYSNRVEVPKVNLAVAQELKNIYLLQLAPK
ncbi:MAG: tetratricopeptide repeat protein [bacterium]